jgi:hypothetical protein
MFSTLLPEVTTPVSVPPPVRVNAPPALVNAVGVLGGGSDAHKAPVHVEYSVVALVGVNLPPEKVPVKVSTVSAVHDWAIAGTEKTSLPETVNVSATVSNDPVLVPATVPVKVPDVRVPETVTGDRLTVLALATPAALSIIAEADSPNKDFVEFICKVPSFESRKAATRLS